MGQQHLRAADLMKQEGLPRGVQVRQDIVEQHHGPFTQILAEQIHLGQPQTQRRGMVLAARAKRPHIDPVDGQPEIVLCPPGGSAVGDR